VATNAGGIRVLRYGDTRAQVVGAEAVLADGSVISRLAGLPKDGTGYDLVSLLCGSEGTLGVVTQLRLRLVPRLRARAVALVALPDTRTAVGPAAGAARAAARPRSRRAALRRRRGAGARRTRACRRRSPRSTPATCCSRSPGAPTPTDALVEAVAELDGLLDANVATEASAQRALWAYREQHTEAISAAGCRSSSTCRCRSACCRNWSSGSPPPSPAPRRRPG
jgi:FAD/FMN-containing dehydrogenase